MTPEHDEPVYDDGPSAPDAIPIDDTDGAPTDAISYGTLDMGDGLSRLDPRFIKAERVSWAIFVGILFLGWLAHAVTAFFLYDGSKPILSGYSVAVTGAVVLLMGILGVTWPSLDYRHRAYRMTDQGLQIRKGVWWRTVIDVPRSRVQHTDVTQGPLARRYGLGKLVVHTAGTMSATVELEGLAHETALALRDRLTGADDDESV